MTTPKLKSFKDHFLHILFLILLPTAILSFDFFYERLPGNYELICQNPLAIAKSTTISKSFADPSTDCSIYLDDFIYLNSIKKDRLLSHLFWDSSSGTGVPFLARWTTRAFSLFSIPFYLLSIYNAVFLSIWLKTVLGGIGVYLFGMSYNLLPSTSLFISVVFQTLGIFIFTPLHPVTDVVAIAPYYLTLFNLFTKGNTKLWIFLTVPSALMFLGGRISSTIVVLISSFLYMLFSDLLVGKKTRQIARESLLVGTAWLFALGLILFQVLPYIEWAKFKTDSISDSIVSLSLVDILSFIIPITTKSEGNNLILQRLLNSPMLLLILFIPLYISGRNLIKNEMKKNIEISWAVNATLFLTSILLHLESGKHINALRILRFLEITDTGWLFILNTALLIGLSIESWNLFNPDECRNCTKKLIIYAPIFWSMIFVLLLAVKPLFALDSNTFWYHFIAGLSLLIALCVYLVITLFSPSPKSGIYAVIIILLVSSHHIYGIHKPYLLYSTLLKIQEASEKLNQIGNRVTFLSEKTIVPNFPNKFNILPPPKEKRTYRLDRFISQASSDPRLWLRAGSNAFLIPSETYNIDNILKLRDKLQLVAQDESGYTIFTYGEKTNRAYIIYSWKAVSDIEQITLSSTLPHTVENIGNDVSGSAEILIVDTNEITPTYATINLPKTKPGILVINDTYYPGWQATVDGKATDIFPVNGAFRGIELSEGEHLVEIRYTCIPFYIGGVLSSISLLIWLLIAKFIL